MPPLFALRPRPHPRKCERRTPNTEHRTPNAERRTSNIEHRTSNIEHRTSNIEHRTKERSGRGEASSRGTRAARPCANAGASATVRSTLLFSSVRRSMFNVRRSRFQRRSSLPIQNPKFKIQNSISPPAMPVRAVPVSSKLASAHSAFNIQNLLSLRPPTPSSPRTKP